MSSVVCVAAIRPAYKLGGQSFGPKTEEVWILSKAGKKNMRTGALSMVVALWAACPSVSYGEPSIGGECEGKLADVVFILDTSSSILPEDFRKQISFTENLVRMFDLSPGKTRVGVTLFSDAIYPKLSMGQTLDRVSILKAIRAITYIGGSTNTGDALKYVLEKEFVAFGRPGVAKVALVLTDGQSQNREKTIEAAQALHDAGVSTFVVGIGTQVDQSELASVASTPTSKYLIQLTDYNALESIRQQLASLTCEADYIPPQGDEAENEALCEVLLLSGVDASTMSTTDQNKVLSFISAITDTLSSTTVWRIRTAQIFNDCPVTSGGTSGGRNYAPLIRKLRYLVPYDRSSPLSSAALLVLDSPVADVMPANREVMRAVFKKVNIIVVGVGAGNDSSGIAKLLRESPSSEKFRSRVFLLNNYDQLASVVPDVVAAVTQNVVCA